MPSLAEWLKQPGADQLAPIRTHSPVVGIHDTLAIAPMRTGLWNLEDYRVESVRAGVIWLVGPIAQLMPHPCEMCEYPCATPYEASCTAVAQWHKEHPCQF